MFNKSIIMTRAWEIYREYQRGTTPSFQTAKWRKKMFACALRKAWEEAKVKRHPDTIQAQIMAIECKGRLSSADYAKLRDLRDAA